MPVIAIAEIFGVSGRRVELVALLSRTERHVRELAGSRRYLFAAQLEAADQFVLLSEWDTHDAMDAYHRSEQFARSQFELSGLVARPSEMAIYTA